jgi:hypothetical protein
MTPSLLQSEAIERLFARSNGSPEYEVWAGPPTARRRAVAADLKSLLAYITQLESEAEAGRKAVEFLSNILDGPAGLQSDSTTMEAAQFLAALPPSQGGDAG